MKKKINRVGRPLLSIVALALLLSGLITLSDFSQTIRNGLFLSLSLSFFNGTVCFLTLDWAFHRSNASFFGALFGGMVWKLIVLGVTTYLLAGRPDFHLSLTLISLAGLTFFFYGLSVYFVCRLNQPA